MILDGSGLPQMASMTQKPFYAGPRNGLSGLGDASSSDWLSSLTDLGKDLITTYNTQQILKANLERARQGLQPLDQSQYAPTYNVGLAPETKNMLLIGGLLLVVILFAGRSKR